MIFSKFVEEVPGKLGIVIIDKKDGGAIISEINENSQLAGKVQQGDQILQINGVDVQFMSSPGERKHAY